MAAPLIIVRDDTIMNPASTVRGRVRGWVDCEYGDALDGAESLTLSLHHANPVLQSLAARDVVYIRNELDEVYEYRVKRINDSLGDPVVRVLATPILHDLNDIILTAESGGGRVGTFSTTLSPSQWLDAVVAEMARHGLTWWTPGTVQLAGLLTLNLNNATCMYVLRQVLSGTTASLWLTRNGTTDFEINLSEITSSSTPRFWVGHTVSALEKEVDTELQATVWRAVGEEDGNSLSTVDSVQFVNDGKVTGTQIDVSDHDVEGADFAIEDDQYVADAAIDYAGRAANFPAHPPIFGPAVSGTESVGRVSMTAYIDKYLCVAVRLGASVAGRLDVFDLDTGKLAHQVTLTGFRPDSVVACPNDGKLYVGSFDSDVVDIVETSGWTVATTLSLGTLNSLFLSYCPTADKVALVNSSGNLVFYEPSTNTVSHTITPATAGLTSWGAYRVVEGGGFLWTLATISGGSGGYALVKINASTLAWVATYDINASLGNTGNVYLAYAYDEVNDQFWCANVAGYIDVFGPTGSLVTNIAPAAHSYSGVRAMTAFEGVIYMAHGAAGRFSVWDGASESLISKPTVESDTLGIYFALDRFGDWVVICGATSTTATYNVFFWHASRASALMRREITAVDAANSRTTLEDAGTGLYPLIDLDPFWLTEPDGTRAGDVWSPIAVALYGHIERGASYARRAHRNLVMRPVPESAYTTDAFPRVYYKRFNANATARFDHLWYAPDVNSSDSWAMAVTGGPTQTNNVITLPVTGFPANAIVQVGDVIRNTAFNQYATVIQRVQMDGSGAGTILAHTTFGSSFGGVGTFYRPLPSAMAGATRWHAFNNGDLPEFWFWYPGVTGNQKLWVGIDGLLFYPTGTLTSLTWAVVKGVGSGSAVDSGTLTADDQPDTYLSSFRQMVEVDTSGLTANNFYRLRLTPAGSTWVGGYLKYVTACVSEVVPPAPFGFNDGANVLWQYAQDALFERSEPLINYRVQALESDPDNPFELGAVGQLRDGGVVATPKVVAWRRRLTENSLSVPLPDMELDNRSLSLVRQLAAKGSI